MKKKLNWHNFWNAAGAYWRKWFAWVWIKKVNGDLSLYTDKEIPEGHQKYILELHNDAEIPFVERVVMIRETLVSIQSPECLKGKCVDCGCPTPDKFYETDACEKCYKQFPNVKNT